MLSKTLDEKGDAAASGKIGVKPTTLRKDQSEYVGVKPKRPFKPDQYRY